MNQPDLTVPTALLSADGRRYRYVSLRDAYPQLPLERLPRSLKILLENVARRAPASAASVRANSNGLLDRREVPFHPNRVLMHDTTCLPALADFAAMRDAVAAQGVDPRRMNPVIPVVLVIDHSVTVEYYARPDAVERNLEIDFRRNSERYRFVKWAQENLSNFRVVPPGTGIIHQINLEFLADVVTIEPGKAQTPLVYPDVLLGTDSHTPMINSLGVLGWGVGGVEAQAAMLGEPIAMTIPEVVGVHVVGAPRAGVTATDIVLHVTALLREHGVIGRFVEFYGAGVSVLSVADRAVIANMAPEYGATCSYFPIDGDTLDYLRLSGRTPEQIALVEAYARTQGLWHDQSVVPQFSSTVTLDLAALCPVVAGPHYPHERTPLAKAPAVFLADLPELTGAPAGTVFPRSVKVPGAEYECADGMVALAAITSCTNTSNPALLIGAGLLARNARRKGLTRKPWVKTSLAPGSAVVTGYLTASGLQTDLDALGFGLVAYGCTTCIGNSGSIEAPLATAVDEHGIRVVGVLSGNRNFDGRVNGKIAGAFLASPPLVVAYAIAGTILRDLDAEPLGNDPSGKPVYLADIWPDEREIRDLIAKHVVPPLFQERYRDVWHGPERWRAVQAPQGAQFPWEAASDYIRRPPYFDGFTVDEPAPATISGARVFLMLGDNVTTDHISPAGTIPGASLAGRYLTARGVPVVDLNQYSTRRSNHEVMLRGAFSNPRLRNEMLDGTADGIAFTADGRQVATAYDAAATYRALGVPLVIVAGRNYGGGSSRDWAAKAAALLGVKAVIAESYERIHRSNLLALGVYPLTFTPGMTRKDLGLGTLSSLSFEGLEQLKVGSNDVLVHVQNQGLPARTFKLSCRIDAGQELEYLRHGGVLPCAVRRTVGANVVR
jgi:aconitate hydratase